MASSRRCVSTPQPAKANAHIDEEDLLASAGQAHDGRTCGAPRVRGSGAWRPHSEGLACRCPLDPTRYPRRSSLAGPSPNPCPILRFASRSVVNTASTSSRRLLPAR